MTQHRPLRERKRQRAEQAIVDAAFTLFAERGFAEVTVAEIAERAEVGRTTFFRYFGDKQEVLFANERHILDRLERLTRDYDGAPEATRTLAQALDQAGEWIRAVCADVTADPERYLLHTRLIADNPELHDRGERKLLHLTRAMAQTLRVQGVAEPEALLAAHLAFACYRTARDLAADDPAALPDAVDTAFGLLGEMIVTKTKTVRRPVSSV
ncbi:TetR/AcrR family transcriptional regulator [Streptomyces sp. NPDC050485]|uniref:TetR/AcrR family transcriptional regulator n=1 Tax=Streptomyces sp. NPDC050485 TaxID=3365617 RepID=UPI0037B137C0